MNKTVVVIDAGGRGAALVQKYSESPHVGKIVAIPGNDFMCENSRKTVLTFPNLKTTSVPEILEICQAEKADLIDVAQDNAVAAGVADVLLEHDFHVFGPTREEGELEWNKAYAREFMRRHKIPQPEYFVFDDEEKGIGFLSTQKDQAWFVKAAGLAEGKGALPAKNNAEAEERIIEVQKFGKIYLLEKWIKSDGKVAEEISAFAVSDGKSWQMIGFAQDHKRALDNDLGENTGGMGCSTPPLVIDNKIKEQVNDIFQKTFDGLKKENRPYKGILYLGGILIGEKVYVIEYNARWGDPEAEVIVPGILNDFYELGLAVARGTLSEIKIKTDGLSRVSVAACAKGYPEDYSKVKGKEIFGIEKALKIKGVKIYGAGIKEKEKKYFVDGGRVLHVIGEGKNVLLAREKAYQALKFISIEGDNLHSRSDIGWRDVARLKK